MKQHLREIVAFMGILLSVVLFTSTYAFGAEMTPGQKLFEAKCTQCHGKDAKGNPKMAKVLKVDPVNVDLTQGAPVTATADELAAIVSKGKNKMPSFKAKLTADQIKQLVEYVKSLQGGK
jgi:mono/diheme cytochrome c family protein